MSSFNPRLEYTPPDVEPALRWGQSFYKVWTAVAGPGIGFQEWYIRYRRRRR
jgi:hypothetical protein